MNMVHRIKPQTEMKKHREGGVKNASARLCDSVAVCVLHDALKYMHRVSMSPCSKLDDIKLNTSNAWNGSSIDPLFSTNKTAHE